MTDLKKALNPNDTSILDAENDLSWKPKDPAELILPYLNEEEFSDEKDIDRRRRKAKEVYNGYGKLIEKSQKLRSEIEEVCKDVTVDIDESSSLNVADAVRRVFGTNGKQITFQMYKLAMEKLADISPNFG